MSKTVQIHTASISTQLDVCEFFLEIIVVASSTPVMRSSYKDTNPKKTENYVQFNISHQAVFLEPNNPNRYVLLIDFKIKEVHR